MAKETAKTKDTAGEVLGDILRRQLIADVVNDGWHNDTPLLIVTDEMMGPYASCWKAVRTLAARKNWISAADLLYALMDDRQQWETVASMITDERLSVSWEDRAYHADRLFEWWYGRELDRVNADTGLSAVQKCARVAEIRERMAAQFEQKEQDARIRNVLEELELQCGENLFKSGRVPTGIGKLDSLCYGGLNGGNLVVIAARPSVGKTAVMLQMALSAAENGSHAVIYSLEMTGSELATRLITRDGSVTGWDIATGRVSVEQFNSVKERYGTMSLYILDRLFETDAITSDMTRRKGRGRIDVAFVDYLGLMAVEDARLRKVDAIAEITRKLKLAAKRLDIPVVLLCQLNRESVKEKRPPQLYDLRDSGSIEQDADIVLMLEKVTDSGGGDLMMYVRKNRNGRPEDEIRLCANRTWSGFTEYGAAPPLQYGHHTAAVQARDRYEPSYGYE